VSGSIGTSIITTIFTSRANFHYSAYADKMDTTNAAFMKSFGALVRRIAETAHMSLPQAQTQAVVTLATQAKLESTVQGINDAFIWTTWISAAGLILSIFLRDVRKDKRSKQAVRQPDPDVLMLPAPKEA
jgi:DHA2 family multidrug resistance protein